jgi:hypothetical protein
VRHQNNLSVRRERSEEGVENVLPPLQRRGCSADDGVPAAVGQDLGHWLPHRRAEQRPPVGTIGESPWATTLPFLASTARAEALLGYSPVRTYAEQLTDDVAWLLQATTGKNWQEVLPDLAQNYSTDFFDYIAEDAYLRTITITITNPVP